MTDEGGPFDLYHTVGRTTSYPSLLSMETHNEWELMPYFFSPDVKRGTNMKYVDEPIFALVGPQYTIHLFPTWYHVHDPVDDLD